MLAPEKSVPLQEHYSLSHNFRSCSCFIWQDSTHRHHSSWGHCITAQAEIRGEPKFLPRQSPSFYFIPHPSSTSTPPVSSFKPLRFLKDKRKAPCENITMETSQAHLHLPAKQLPNWSFTSYWITVGHLLSFKLLWIPYFPEKFIFRKEEGGGKGRIQYSWLVQSYCEKQR